jgi:RecB family exonuclease
MAWKTFLEGHGDKKLSASFTRIADFCTFVQSGGSPSELLRSLRSVAGNGEVSIWGAALSRFVMSDPGLDESARRLNAASRELVQKLESVSNMEKDIGPAGSVTLRGADASTFLSTWAERSTVWQAPGSRESLSLHAGSPPVLARHPVFIVTGLTADAWPGRLRESPLLDDQRKEALHRDPGIGLSPVHLPLLREKRMQREALLRRIIASADDLCILSRPRQDGSGRPLLPSMMLESAISSDDPWITPTGGDPPFARSMKDVLPAGGEAVISNIEIRENDHPRMPGRLSALPPPTPWPEGVTQGASMSSIDTWLECPFKFYAGRVLGLGKTRTSGFDPLTAGTMIHALWEKVWTERLSSGADLFCLAEKYWEETVHGQYPDLEKLPRHLGRLRAQTLKMAHLQQDMENSGLARARKGQKREEKVNVTVGGIPFYGRYDRLDILQDGTALVFDYKTGRGSGLSRSLQLAAYAAALKETGSVEISGCIFLSQGDNGVTAILEGSAAGILAKWIKKNQPKLGDMIGTAKTVMEDMALSISESRFIPNYENTQACMFCDFHGLCRKGESTGRGNGEDDGNDD